MIALQEQTWWWLARSSGIVALVLSALSVIWGLLYSTKLLQGQPSPKWLLDLHRFWGGSAVVFTGVHILGLVLDSFVHFSWLEILVPFASAWNPLGVALGVVAMYLLVAVQGSSLMMKRMPRPWWKRIHLTSYAMFWLGLVHGAMVGTEASNPLYIGLTGVLTLVVLVLTVYRTLTRRAVNRRTAAPAPVVAAKS